MSPPLAPSILLFRLGRVVSSVPSIASVAFALALFDLFVLIAYVAPCIPLVRWGSSKVARDPALRLLWGFYAD